jgi:hypothetical protein
MMWDFKALLNSTVMSYPHGAIKPRFLYAGNGGFSRSQFSGNLFLCNPGSFASQPQYDTELNRLVSGLCLSDFISFDPATKEGSRGARQKPAAETSSLCRNSTVLFEFDCFPC